LLLIGFLALLSVHPVPAARQAGDVDGDGRVTPIDAALAVQFGLEIRPPFSIEAEKAADVSLNNRIEPLDAAMIQQIFLGIRPKVAIQASPQGTGLPLRLSLSAAVSGGRPPYTYAWDFTGDGVIDSSAPEAVASYATEGAYRVFLTVTDSSNRASRVYYDLPVDFTPPPAAADFVVTARNSACLLTWRDTAVEKLSGYNIYRLKPGESSFTRISPHPAASFWMDEFLDNGAAYSYHVRPVDLAGNEGPATPTLSAVPGACPARPVIRGATRTGSQSIRLTWNPVPGAVTYQLYAAERSPLFLEKVDTGPVAAATWEFRALATNMPLYFAAAAVDGGGRVSRLSQPVLSGCHAAVPDTNADGIPDGWCEAFGFPRDQSIAALDLDGDGLTGLMEYQLGTHPTQSDTDEDTLADGAEAGVYHSDPLLPDTDGGGLEDGREVSFGLNPSSPADDLPSAPENLRVARLAGRNVDLTWEPSPDARVVGYNLYFAQGTVLSRQNAALVTGCRVTLPNVPLGGTVTLVVRAVLGSGTEGPVSESLRLVLAEASPSSATTVNLDQASVTIPAGAITAPVTVGMATTPVETLLAEGGRAFDLLPHGVVFNQPVRIQLPVKVAVGTNATPDALSISTFAGDRWVDLPGTRVLPGGAALEADISHFSMFRVELPEQGSLFFGAFSMVQPDPMGRMRVRAATQGALEYRSKFWGLGDLVENRQHRDLFAVDYTIPIHEVDCDKPALAHRWTSTRKLHLRRVMSVWRNGECHGATITVRRQYEDGPETTTEEWNSNDDPRVSVCSGGWNEFLDLAMARWHTMDFEVGYPAELGMKNNTCYNAWIEARPAYVSLDPLRLSHVSFPEAKWPETKTTKITINGMGTGGPEFVVTGPKQVLEDAPQGFTISARPTSGGITNYSGVINASVPGTVRGDGWVTWLPRQADVKPGAIARFFATDVKGNAGFYEGPITVLNSNDVPYFTQPPSASPLAVIPRQFGGWPDGNDAAQSITLTCEAADEDLPDYDRLRYEWVLFYSDRAGEVRDWTIEPHNQDGVGTNQTVTLWPPALSDAERRASSTCTIVCMVTDRAGAVATNASAVIRNLKTLKWAGYAVSVTDYTYRPPYYEYVACNNSTTDWKACGGWPDDGHDPKSDLYSGGDLHWRYHPGRNVPSGSHYETRWHWE
jgi:hypothetical protein